MRRILSTGILLITGILAGCSSTAFLYNNAPWWIQGKIDDYFSITSRQERQLDRDIGSFFKWHRYQELPEYADLISKFNRQFADGLTREELELLFEQVRAARARLAESSLDAVSRFLVSVSSKQLDYFDNEFQQHLDKDRKQLSLPTEQQQDRQFSRFLNNLEDWFGNFNDKQKQALRRLNESRPEISSIWLKRREQRHRKFLQFLRTEPDAAAISMYLRSRYLETPGQTPDDLRQAESQYWLTAMMRIDEIILPVQRQRAISRLDDYRRDFIHLSQPVADESNVKLER